MYVRRMPTSVGEACVIQQHERIGERKRRSGHRRLSDKDDQAAINYDHGNRAVGIALQGGT